MAIIVDKLIKYPSKPHGHLYWCHAISDFEDPDAAIKELQVMAYRLRLRSEWIDVDHYDLTASKQAEAIKYGAKIVDRRELTAIIRARRNVLRFGSNYLQELKKFRIMFGLLTGESNE